MTYRSYNTKEIRSVTIETQCLSILWLEYSNKALSAFHVMIFDEDDGYTFSEKFASQADAELCFERRERELRRV